MTRIAALALAMALLLLSCATTPKAAESASSPAVVPAVAPDEQPAVEPMAESVVAEMYAGASESALKVIAEANDLLEAGKFKSAFDALGAADPESQDPFVLAAKTRLALLGAVRTDLHRAFAFVDLEEGLSVEEARSTEGEYENLPFDPPALADALEMSGIAIPGILSRILAEYYYDILVQYEGQWLLPDEEVLAKCADYYGRAYEAQAYDALSLKIYAEVLGRAGRAGDAEPVLREAIAIDPSDPVIRYNLGLSLLAREMRVEALAAFDGSIEAYGEDPARFDSIALAARTASELGDDGLLQKYLASADAVYDGASSMPNLLRHYICVERGDDAAAMAAADALVGEYGGDPAVVRALIGTWYGAGKIAEAFSFLERNIAGSQDDLTLGALNFYLAVLLIQEAPTEEAPTAALAALDAAEASMTKVLEPENGVFTAIAEMRAALTGEGAEPEAAAEPAPATQPGAPNN
jgi:tetratricopeptide (TPR) repeat protein